MMTTTRALRFGYDFIDSRCQCHVVLSNFISRGCDEQNTAAAASIVLQSDFVRCSIHQEQYLVIVVRKILLAQLIPKDLSPLDNTSMSSWSNSTSSSNRLWFLSAFAALLC
jgi:hypothetical protein